MKIDEDKQKRMADRASKAMTKMLFGKKPKGARAQKKLAKTAKGDMPKPPVDTSDEREPYNETVMMVSAEKLLGKIEETSKANKAKMRAAVDKHPTAKKSLETSLGNHRLTRPKNLTKALTDIHTKNKDSGGSKRPYKPKGQTSPKGAPDKTYDSGKYLRKQKEKRGYYKGGKITPSPDYEPEGDADKF